MTPEPMQHANALPNSQSPLLKWFDRNGNTATAVICVAMIGSAIWYSYSRVSSTKNENAWAQYSQSQTAEHFANIADVYPSTDVAAWARLSAAERLLDSGISLMFTDREAGLGELKESDKAFHQVLNAKSAPAATRERALVGLAKCTEAQSDGDNAKAIASYEALLTQFPKSSYKATAEERITALKTEESKAFYAWFHKQKPKPADKNKPTDGLPAGHPPIDLPTDENDGKSATKPKGPKLDVSEDDAKSDSAKPDEKKGDEKPEVGDKKPDEKPAPADKPNDEPKSDAPKTESKDAPADAK